MSSLVERKRRSLIFILFSEFSCSLSTLPVNDNTHTARWLIALNWFTAKIWDSKRDTRSWSGWNLLGASILSCKQSLEERRQASPRHSSLVPESVVYSPWSLVSGLWSLNWSLLSRVIHQADNFNISFAFGSLWSAEWLLFSLNLLFSLVYSPWSLVSGLWSLIIGLCYLVWFTRQIILICLLPLTRCGAQNNLLFSLNLLLSWSLVYGLRSLVSNLWSLVSVV